MLSTPDHAKTIFLDALEIASAEARQTYLDEECGNDEELRAEVDELLRHHKQFPPSEGPVVVAGTIDMPAEPQFGEMSGTQIGPYKLLQQIGERGMGTVYMAEQTQPVQRKVALKVIKAGMDSRQVIARFEAERQALAVMDHVNIARVLDAGTTESGLPYFVMELVHGVPITKYCDDNHLTPRQRLELFVPVCQAIQHAHQKGIIHRDIKPSNVMVTLYDGKPVPKVIDFGVAKATEQKLTERTLFTQYGTMVGTLEYMSPEQAEMSALGVDTRSDIYSLGVLLYELLTGSTPLSHKTMKEAAYAEILRMIKEEEPPRPSTRLSDSGEALASISANRHMEPAKLTKLVRGELDWIVMKTLEKDRNRRYETANGFAADVQRYLADEPVLACPPSAGYRLRKFARRNKTGLVMASVIGVALLLAVGSLGWTLRDRAARQSRIGAQVDLIVDEAEQLEKEQKWPEALAAAQRADALTAGGADAATLERVRQVLHALQMVAGLEDLRLREARGAGAGSRFDERRPLLYAAAFRDFEVDVETLPVEEAAARLRARPGLAIALAAALDDWARSGHPRDPNQSKRLWALAAAVDPDPWRVTVRQASEARDVNSLIKLANAPDTARHPLQSQLLLASSLALCNQPEQALSLLERACEVHPSDFGIHNGLAYRNSAVRPARLEAAVRHGFAARALRPRSAGTWLNLGNALRDQNKLDEAIACFKKAMDLDSNYVDPAGNLGAVLQAQNKLDEAIVYCRKAIEIDPKCAASHSNLGNVLCDQKKLDEGIRHYRKAIELDPKYAPAHNNLGIALCAQGKLDDGIACYKKAIELDPESADNYNSLGGCLHDQNKLDEAIVAYLQAIELDPNHALAHNNLGIILGGQKKLDEAIRHYRKAIELDPKFVGAYHNLGVTLGQQNKVDEAIAAYRKAIALDPKEAHLASMNLGSALCGQGKFDEAIAVYRKAIEVDPKDAQVQYNLGNALRDHEELDEAIDAYRTATELDPKFVWAYDNLGNLLGQRKDYDQAVAAFRKSIEIDPKNAIAYSSLGNVLSDQKKLDEAIIAYRKVIELEPNSAMAWRVLGWLMYRIGDWRASIEALEKSCKLEKGGTGDARQWILLALAHAKLAAKEVLPEKEREHHLAEARRWYKQADKQIDSWWRARPGDVTGQAIWDFRAEARELMKME